MTTPQYLPRRLVAGTVFAAVAAVLAWAYSIVTSSAPSAEEPRPQTLPPIAEQVAAVVAPKPAVAADRGPAIYPPIEPLREEVQETSANQPEEWRDGGPYTLRVQKTRTVLPRAAENGGPHEVDLLAYNGRLVGPTIRVQRGSTVKINFINELPKTGAPAVKADPQQEDQPHGLYVTNLHTHGLHVSPAGNSDNVFREIAPGQSFQYTFMIPPDHPTGTFWYHPHKHGSVAFQMGNGMAGALIVEGGPPGTAPSLDDIPEIARAKERIFVLQQLVMARDQHGIGFVDPNDVYDAPDAKAYQVTAINGTVMPVYTMRPGEVQRWRFIHAGKDEPFLLQWRTADGNRILNFPFHEIAVDGLATGTMQPVRSVKLFPGNRSDVLVKAPAQRGVYMLTSLLESADGERMVYKFVGKLVVQGPEQNMDLPTAAQLAACQSLAAIDPAECKVKRDLVFTFDDKKKMYHINGVSFSKQSSVEKMMLGSAEEWTLSAPSTTTVPADPLSRADDPHPFHIHVNPFQVVQIEDLRSKRVTPVNEWRDTIAVEKGKKITIRMRFRDFAGKTVYHCHTLDHEDQGMMRTFRIVDPQRPGDDTDLAECSVPAPALKLATTPNASWELNSLRGRNVVLVFFRGMDCLHCTQQLKNLLQEARELTAAGATVVAVSSEPIADRDKAVQSLAVPAGLSFQLFEDEGHRGFRTFGCYADDGPRHGLFLIDPSGTLRAKYVGDVPFADAKEVSARVRQLSAPSPRTSAAE